MKYLKLFEAFIWEADTYSDYPEAAKQNAKKAIDWKEKYGRDEVTAATRVGWARAHQLSGGEAISADTVKRMSAFNRHRKNSKIDPKKKDTPWKDNGYVAWLTWGGDEGIDWAMRTSKKIEESFLYESKMEKKEVQAVVDKVYPKIIKKLGKNKRGTPKVEVHDNIYARISGIEGHNGDANPHAEYERHVNKIYLYTPRMTDKEQIVRSLLHEYTHSLQDPKNKEKHRKLSYDNNPDEIEAHKAEEDWKKYI